MTGLRTERLTEFSAWVAKHITGDEKGEAQIFLDRLFIAFGHKGIKEAGATLEMRVKKDVGEMKKRGQQPRAYRVPKEDRTSELRTEVRAAPIR
jgi:hypothetical protein